MRFLPRDTWGNSLMEIRQTPIGAAQRRGVRRIWSLKYLKPQLTAMSWAIISAFETRESAKDWNHRCSSRWWYFIIGQVYFWWFGESISWEAPYFKMFNRLGLDEGMAIFLLQEYGGKQLNAQLDTQIQELKSRRLDACLRLMKLLSVQKGWDEMQIGFSLPFGKLTWQ